MARRDLAEESVTRSIIGAFFEVYNTLGFGFLEYIYKKAIERELRSAGHHVGREVGVTVMYKGETLAEQRVDMIVDGKVVVEVKTGAVLPTGSQRQLYSYLRATHLEVGLLLHFGLEAKFYRLYHDHPEQVSTR